MPAQACDAHCHIFGPTDRFPLQPDAAYLPADTPLGRYRTLAATLGLSRAVFVQPAVYGSDHRAMIDAIARGDGRYRGVGILDATVDDVAVAALDAAGIRGARFNFMSHLGNQPSQAEIERTLGRVAPLGWHLIFHLDGAALLEQADWLATLACPVVIDHMVRLDADGGVDQPAFRRLLALAALPHVWVKISAADRMGDDLDAALPFMAAIAAAAPDRTLWGTDWPHPNVRWMPDDGDLIDLLARAVPDEARRYAILVDNPHRLYRFEG